MFNVTNFSRFLLVAFPCNAFYFNLPHNHFAHIFTNYYTLFPLHWKQLRLWEVCSRDDPWSFAASNSLMRSIHRCTWKSLQLFIIIIMMASFMRVLKSLYFIRVQ